jgi:hypothetical protein
MTNFTNNSTNFTPRTGLYRVWVSQHDDGKAPFVSIWMDPSMTAFEQQLRSETAAFSEAGEPAIAEEIEDHLRRILVASSHEELAASTAN